MIALSAVAAAALATAVVLILAARARAREATRDADLLRQQLIAAQSETRALVHRHTLDLLAARDRTAADLAAERSKHSAELVEERNKAAQALNALDARRAQEQQRHGEELARLHEQLTAAESARSAIEAQLKATSEHAQLIEEAKKSIGETIALASREALNSNAAHVVQLAEQTLAKQQESSKAELEKRAQAVEQMVKPVAEQLGKVDEKIGKLEKSAEVQAATVSEQLRSVVTSNDRLQHATAQLATALRAPATRGQWGEKQLRRTLELAGLRAHVDFDEQPVASMPDGVLRPDVAVHLPGGKTVLLDSKVPLEAFQRALEAPAEDRPALLRTHAAQLRAHVESLSRKQYWDAFAGSPEMAVLFLPSDGLLAAALEADPTLHEDAFARRIVLATPATLLALLLTVAHVWKQESLAENARAIAAEGRALHKRLVVVSDHLSKHGRALESALKSFNAVVGSFDSRVVPAARRLEQLDAASDGAQLVPQLELDIQPHTPKALAEATSIDEAN
jgi:DNA recombination protein RmuC